MLKYFIHIILLKFSDEVFYFLWVMIPNIYSLTICDLRNTLVFPHCMSSTSEGGMNFDCSNLIRPVKKMRKMLTTKSPTHKKWIPEKINILFAMLNNTSLTHRLPTCLHPTVIASLN